jgi:pre-rRNA-processing protein TSR1
MGLKKAQTGTAHRKTLSVQKTKNVKKVNGRVSNGASSVVIPKLNRQLSKKDRKNQAKQKVQHHQKLISSKTHSPVNVAVVVFHGSVDEIAVYRELVNSDPFVTSDSPFIAVSTEIHGGRRVQFVFIRDRTNIQVTLDAVKAADVLLGIFPGSDFEVTYEKSVFDEQGYQILSALKMQGLPGMVLGANQTELADKESLRNFTRYFESEFSSDSKHHKIIGGLNLFSRQIQNMNISENQNINSWRANHGYMLVNSSEVIHPGQAITVSGYVKGLGFGVGGLVNITGDICPWVIERIEYSNGAVDQIGQERVENLPGVLESHRPPEEGEQLDFTAEEIAIINSGNMSDDEAGDSDADEELEDEEEEDEFDPFDLKSSLEQPLPTEESFQLRSREDMDFPDEVDTPTTQPARVRFQKYRGLRSLRTCQWDPYEELPVEFSQIYELESPEIHGKEGIKSLKISGMNSKQSNYCKLFLRRSEVNHTGLNYPLVISTIQNLETKMTLVHLRMQLISDSTVLKSKDEFEIQMGFRRFKCRPIFSEPVKGRENDLSKYCRNISSKNNTYTVSFYAPVNLTSMPCVLMDLSGNLLMWGSTHSVNPSKPIILKRILLTGYTVKAHKRSAVIRYMFFNPQDILWFKPVELITKKGLRGNISEPLGLQGHMKCRFNDILTHDDIVCLPLYKRVFPKWQ